MDSFSQHVGATKGQRGVTVVIVALFIFVLIGLAALAIDLGHLFVVRNELQNAADAGALAGARFLYVSDGAAINPEANPIAYSAATGNRSEKAPVEVRWNGGNTGDVQRGHWSFATRTFTPNDSLLPIDYWGVSSDELDRNLNFVNAVRVRTRRQDMPAASFLAGIFGYENFVLSSEAVAYIGFAGSLGPLEVDEPIALCNENLVIDGKLTCTIGRMINSGARVAAHETGGWTDFNQDNPCLGGTNAGLVTQSICKGNPTPIVLGSPVATNGGEIESAMKALRNCWGNRSQPWTVTLLVIECPGNNVGPCEKAVGVVTVKIVWISGSGEDPQYKNAPRRMGDWSNNNPDGKVRWNSFVHHFNLKNVDNTPAPYAKKSIYFLPDCEAHTPTGTTGGENFGILAKIPVLVR